MRKKITAILLILTCFVSNTYAFFPNFDLEGLQLEGEVLWWQAKADGLNVQVIEAIDESNIYYRFWDYGYDPGFRVGFSYDGCGWNGLSLYANFTHFRATDTVNLDLLSTVDSSFTITTPLNGYFVGGGDAFLYTGLSDFLYNRFDIGLGRDTYEYGALSIVPRLAFTYMHTRQSLSEVVDTFDDDTINNKVSYSGYGVTIGFDSTYEFWTNSGFALYSSLDLSGLWGSMHNTYSLDNLSELDIASTAFQNQSTWVGRWVSDVQVGLQYQSQFCSCYQFTAHIGWEFLYLADQLNFFRVGDPSSVKVNGLTIGLALGF